MGLRQAKFRRTTFVKEQVLMTATAQNIKENDENALQKRPRKRSRFGKGTN
jgi:hypothetical protein